jgi:hypothetical protein
MPCRCKDRLSNLPISTPESSHDDGFTPNALHHRHIPGLRYPVGTLTSLVHWAAARGENAAKRRRQRRERVPPWYPKRVSKDCAPEGSALKWPLKFLSFAASHETPIPLTLAVWPASVRDEEDLYARGP